MNTVEQAMNDLADQISAEGMIVRAAKIRSGAVEICRQRHEIERLQAQREEEFRRSADKMETVDVDRAAVIINLIRENNRREAEIERLKADNEWLRGVMKNAIAAQDWCAARQALEQRGKTDENTG